jgi:hypothetical protein
VRALDVRVVAQARQRDGGHAQPGELLVGVHRVLLPAGQGHLGLGLGQQLGQVGRPDGERARVQGQPPLPVLLTQPGVDGRVIGR